jgi:ribonuclease P protein component
MAVAASHGFSSARILSKRADFLRAKAIGQRYATQGFTLQWLPVLQEPGLALGFTCAKRTFASGVAANRARRRLKEAVRRYLKEHPAPQGVLAVMVGKPAVLTMGFPYLQRDVAKAFGVAAANLSASSPTLSNCGSTSGSACPGK